jgi:hypothetical protein
MRVQTLLGVVSVGAMSAMFGATALWGTGCGGGTTTGGDAGTDATTESGGGNKKDMSAPPNDTGGPQDTGVDTGFDAGNDTGTTKDSGTDTGMSFETSTCSGVDCCPDTPCDAGAKCCANLTASDAGPAGFVCKATCPVADTLDCTSPGDCSGGDFCCVKPVLSGGGAVPACLRTSLKSVSSSCESSAACASDINTTTPCMADDTVRLCASSKDCTESKYPDCCELPLGGRVYAACVTAEIKGLLNAFDKSLKCD